MSAASIASSSSSSSTSSELSEGFLHDVYDKLEDLSYPSSVCDSIADQLRASPSPQSLHELIQNILNDISIFSFGQSLSISPSSLSSSSSSSFVVELCSYLSSLSFPFSVSPFNAEIFWESFENRCETLDFLLAELEACRMIAWNKQKNNDEKEETKNDAKHSESNSSSSSSNAMDIETKFPEKSGASVDEVSRQLSLLASCLNISSFQSFSCISLLQSIHSTLFNLLRDFDKISPEFRSIFTCVPLLSLSDYSSIHLSILISMHSSLYRDSDFRHRLLLQRFSVTLSSFCYSAKGKLAEGNMQELAHKKLKNLEKRRGQLSDIYPLFTFGLPELLKTLLKTGENNNSDNNKKKEKSAIKNVIIGKVPDRGGRIDDAKPRDFKDMPTFRPRIQDGPNNGSGSGRGGGRGRGRGRGRERGGGGAVQGGWNNDGDSSGGDKSSGSGGDWSRGSGGGGVNRGKHGNYRARGKDRGQ